jgi:predicted permease
MHSLLAELRASVRALGRVPAYVVSTSGVVALAIALATVAYALVDPVLFRPLPFPDEGRLFSVAPAYEAVPLRAEPFDAAPREVDAWAQAIPGAVVGTVSYRGRARLGPAESVNAIAAGPTYLEALGITPLLGGWTPADFVDPSPVRPALLTHRFWVRRFGGDPGVLGRSFVGDRGEGIRVVGILPPRFVVPDSFVPEVVLASASTVAAPLYRRNSSRQVVIRLPAGMTVVEAQTRLSEAARALSAEWPAVTLAPTASATARAWAGPAVGVTVTPLRDLITAPTRTFAWLVLGGVLLVLAQATFNVAGLAAARTVDRQREVATRRALGAGDWQIARVLAVETLLIVLIGTLGGLLLAPWAFRVTLDLIPTTRLIQDATLNARVVVVIAAAALATFVVMAAAVTREGHRALARVLADGGASTTRRRSWMPVTQIALATVVTIACALVLASMVRIWTSDRGFETDDRLVMHFYLTGDRSPAATETAAARFAAHPGVRDIGVTATQYLLERMRVLGSNAFASPTSAGRDAADSPISHFVTHGYLDAAGLTLVDGRWPTESEFASGASVAVVSPVAARLYWGERSALGQTLMLGDRAFSVVGVVNDARFVSRDMASTGDIYAPIATNPRATAAAAFVRVAPDQSAGALLRDFRAQCPECRIASLEPAIAVVNSTIQTPRFRAWLFGAFGVAALVISAIGIVGVVAMTTARRKREIGIRLALGTTHSAIARLILREQVVMLIAGIVLGGLAAAWTVRLLGSYMYETSVYDWKTWSMTLIVLVAIAGVSVVWPALRAARVDIVRVLRPE